MNESLLAADQPSSAQSRVLIAACGAVVVATATWLVITSARFSPDAAALADTKSVVDVHAEPDTRWSEHVDGALDRVSLADGAAAFTVHPHPARRVIIELPDGELEDMGTVFEIRVEHEHTRRIAVTEGTVAVRLHGTAEFRLTAGQAWDANPSLPTPERDAENAPRTSQTAADPSSEARPALARAGERNEGAGVPALPRFAAKSAVAAPGEPSAKVSSPSASAASSAKAEDDAYLTIVGLLRSDHYADARAAAKRYLLQFPNGFRRVEVLNIATRAEGDAGDAQ